MPVLLALMLLTSLEPVTSFASPVEAATCAIGSAEPGCVDPAMQDTAAEQQLAEMYVPIVMLNRQQHECDNEGEPYLPAPVEVVFDDPETLLRQRASSGSDPVIMESPGLDDLVGLDETYYLDFPGNARNQ